MYVCMYIYMRLHIYIYAAAVEAKVFSTSLRASLDSLRASLDSLRASVCLGLSLSLFFFEH